MIKYGIYLFNIPRYFSKNQSSLEVCYSWKYVGGIPTVRGERELRQCLLLAPLGYSKKLFWIKAKTSKLKSGILSGKEHIKNKKLNNLYVIAGKKTQTLHVLKSEEEEAAVHVLTHRFQKGICPVCRPSMDIPSIWMHPKLPLLLWQRDLSIPPLHFRGSLAVLVRGVLLYWGFWFGFSKQDVCFNII